MATHPSIRIEGGLLGPEVFDQLLDAELPGQKPADFGLDGRRNLTDEIAAVFADARALWGVFQNRLARLSPDDMATTVTRDWVTSFLGLLGYEAKYNPRAHEVDGMTFAVSHRASEIEESPPIHIVGARQELGRVPPSGRPRLAPHSLLQEYLNRAEALWGLVTNGLTLRLLRDCTFVRRQAYVEFDLAAILEEQGFQDFAVLYRLLHRTRLPRGTADAPDCLLEQYYNLSVEQGGRVRDHLRDGVEECIKRLGTGFLRHRANGELRRRVSPECTGNEHIGQTELYRQILRLVYRFLFLLVSEDRGMLSADPLYRESYGIARLRRLMDNRAAYTEHDDLWQSLRVLWLVLISEQPQPALGGEPMASALGLAVLNGELFAPQDLDSFTITNRDLLEAMRYLAYYQERPSQPARRVNYAALNVEELGSVYESLLEFHPHVAGTDGAPTFDLLQEGRERRSTGSHYTPPELVAPLIKHALEPVLAERLRGAATARQKELAILSLKVCDPACGSGHFLLAAARRLGKELARVRTGEDEPAPERVREAIRDVVTHCIYGVDKNPLAVELCRVALWLESHAGGKPLTFLDHRIRCGDSLVGVFDLEVLGRGIPDEAYKPVGGDDRAVARQAKRRNADERHQSLLNEPFGEQLRQLADRLAELDGLTEDTIEQVRAKADACRSIEGSLEFRRLKAACNVWTAAFFQVYGGPAHEQLTTDHIRTALGDGELHNPRLDGFVFQSNLEQRFFHWPLAFPEVFAAGGFDIILGNPPFMGGLKISTAFGEKYRQWLPVIFDPFKGTADLCAAFFRRAFQAVKPAGRFGMIATNTIGQGDTREAGLAQLARNDGMIGFAQRFVKWPGQANVEVNLVAVGKDTGGGPRHLDGQSVDFISSRLDAEPEAEPRHLAQNDKKAFIGDFVRGIGFVLQSDEAADLLSYDPRHAECLLPYMTGEDLNSDAQQRPSRWVICFHNWDLERARQYPALVKIVEERVRGDRERLVNSGDRRDRERWWLFARYRGDLRVAMVALNQVMAVSRVTEHHAVCFLPATYVFSDRLVVFAFAGYYHFALIQSSIHELWSRRQGFTLESRYCYAPEDAFDTFPFPQSCHTQAQAEAERLGEAYHEHRRQVMLARQVGLTRAYNLFRNRDCADADIVRLRELHAEMDRAILACYGWTDLDPGHGFHVNERGQTRFTVSPDARLAILRRLLALNLEIAAAEAAGGGGQ